MTILFADLAGFTARAEALDPEDVQAFLHPWYELLGREIAGHGGSVERHLGDGVMALFGAPVAHEDDPERAVRAALRIQERLPGLGLDLQARVGINTGPVLFAAATGPGREDVVTGDAVNTAARLQAAAPVGGVVVGEATYRATAHVFAWDALAPVEAKGKVEPVPAWRAVAPLARSAGRLQPEASPFVGRDHELAALVSLFERARDTPSLEVVTVIADPGLGKSRLVRELARHVDALPELVTWRVGRCLPYGDGISFWALGEIIKAHAGILDTDDQVALHAKLDAALTEPDPGLRAWMRDRIGPLVGLETSSHPPQRDEAFAAWCRFVEAIAAAGPVVLIVEDLHWADDALVAFLEHLAATTSGLPILLVATARPEVAERHPGWPGRTARTTAVSLGALGDREMTELLAAALPDASPGLLKRVLDRAAGSPLYAEQLAAMARDRPDPDALLGDEAIPPTVLALLASRIDALAPRAKDVLLDASVVGKTFWSGAVAALGGRERPDVERVLGELARRELVRPVIPSTMADEAEYAFVHALVRDVAYGELTRGSRLARHRATAGWITARAGATLGEAAEIVVAHLERALGLAAVAAPGEIAGLEDELLDALLAAAAVAGRSDVPRAITQLKRALDALRPDDPRRPTVLAQLGWANVSMCEFGEAVGLLEAARGLLVDMGDGRTAAEMAAPMAVALTNAGQLERAAQVLAEARETLAPHPGPALLAVLAEQAYVLHRAAHWALARQLGHEAVTLAVSLGLPPPPRALLARAADGDIERAIAIAEASGDLRTALNGLTNLGISQQELAASLASLDTAITFARAHGLPDLVPLRVRLQLTAETGHMDGVLDGLAAVEQRSRALGDAFNAVAAEVALTDLRLDLGLHVESVDHLEGAYHATGIPLGELALLQARVEVANGRLPMARNRLGEAIKRQEQGEVGDLVGLVETCLRAGDLPLARRALLSAPPVASLVGSEYDAGFADASHEVATALVLEADGNPDLARVGYERALAAFAGLGRVRVQAEMLVRLGRCLLAVGETRSGIEHLRTARTTLAQIGARPRLAEIDAMLASAGTGPERVSKPARLARALARRGEPRTRATQQPVKDPDPGPGADDQVHHEDDRAAEVAGH